ncbi:RNA-guided endonuclease TnpB family protein [Halomonas sp. PGE1]|uniref:RNA-guided endonuclease InsQ/TnpB family protein n=1 Tax=Halomonas sp. PGE1 TaxID=2730360 RepID=UPI001473A02C|nr:RNA-guided endonuclease TnpB family protein [Halomonas sp. PGE1]QJQ99348.1 transposase [Halomonas sp. PGE1]
MKQMLGLKYRLNPTPQQAARLRVLAGHSRFVWNQALAECLAARERGERVPRYGTMAGWITAWKRQDATAFLTEAYTDNLQQKLRDLDTAWQRHFTPGLAADAPRFKKKGKSRDAIRFVNFPKYCRLDHRRVKLPAGLGWVRFRQSRPVVGKITSCTVGLDGGHWHISFQVEIEVAESPRHPATSAVGLDMGVVHFAVDSNGTAYAGRNSFRQIEKRIATAQRQLKHKVRFSQNWKKQKARITRLHQTAANARRDTLHKLSTAISQNHAMVAVEDLRVRNMSASAKGTLATPGNRVKQKAGLNKAILDQGWFEFRRQLGYKQTWRGGLLIAVPARHTSQTCPECGHVAAGNRPSRATFRCQACDHTAHADVVGARNVLARAHEQLSGQGLPVAPVK